MKCARLHLHERSKPAVSSARRTPSERPRRYCQKRLVNPDHEEDPRWADLLERFHCNANDDTLATIDNTQAQQNEDLFLSVQNLKFNGDVHERKRSKTCFKYKALSDGKKHRMFVKQIVEDEENDADECSSQLTCYYFDDYVKYILNNEPSAPVSEKSSVLFYTLNNKVKENKAVQVESRKQGLDLKKHRKLDGAVKNNCRIKNIKETVKEEPPDLISEDTKVVYHKSGKRKCLTISRAQSPETVQVIRVDVVCNYTRSSTISELDDNKRQNDVDTQITLDPKILNSINMKTSHFSNKYLLTNTTKTLDENISGGAKWERGLSLVVGIGDLLTSYLAKGAEQDGVHKLSRDHEQRRQ
ncbi:hypothetical protein MSG28_000892 [Choristoneura fumiferana]|uniref:Uncharacterized protein n=1 Tax=Choristoneura fumiferana TaxID=7141 RepID=A0ACC0K3C9_CHOFU|nr:hypothetical protein MSG28_000892 [Choristoneura fumiferana]